MRSDLVHDSSPLLFAPFHIRIHFFPTGVVPIYDLLGLVKAQSVIYVHDISGPRIALVQHRYDALQLQSAAHDPDHSGFSVHPKRHLLIGRYLYWAHCASSRLEFDYTKDKQCCHGKVSIPADLLDAYQDIPFGTPAHDKSYGRRNPVEKTFSMIKDKGGLKAGWCRSFDLAAHAIGALALSIAHNLKETIGIERTQTEKPDPPARPKSHQPTRRNILADSLTPRAPPD